MPRLGLRVGAPLGAVLLAVGLAGCATESYREPDPAPEPAPSVSGASAELTELLSEIATAFGTQEQQGNELIAPDSSVQVAVADLRAQLQLSDQVAAVAAAWAQDWADRDPVAEVDVQVQGARVVGSWRGNPLAQATVAVTTTEDPGPTAEHEYEYLVSWRSGTLEYLAPLARQDQTVLVDAGIGLGSSTGSVDRFLDLVRQSRWAALAHFSAGANSDRTELEVLQSVIEASPELHLVEMPAPTDGGARRVYAVTGIDQVVAQFSVDVAERTVVFQRTV
ncbi:MAG TPA: hypothetical protein H9815_11700 [Candidatus Ruania gallistercoris]|uniref:Uncharacterized protein n=1 Tax=Candidatus Ruania gallistercoris TaxID=2838746 RepID=A0A9D2EEY8_9MICO|nr:hypothetical protein [Candidatus Ruania gallistercoris]